MADPEDIVGVLDWVDRAGGAELTAEATLQLNNGALMSVRGGGPTVHAQAGIPDGFDSYEVDLDHEPARFWSRYGGSEDSVLYAYVPRLLLLHHVIRRGGIAYVETSVRRLERIAVVSLSLQMPYGAQRLVQQALEGIAGVSILRSNMPERADGTCVPS